MTEGHDLGCPYHTVLPVPCRRSGELRVENRLPLSFGTRLERTAPESLSGPQYAFVHGHIWIAVFQHPLDRVWRPSRNFEIRRQKLTPAKVLSRSMAYASASSSRSFKGGAVPECDGHSADLGHPVKFWNESGTNRARIADSGTMWLRSRRYMESAVYCATRSGNGSPIH